MNNLLINFFIKSYQEAEGRNGYKKSIITLLQPCYSKSGISQQPFIVLVP